MSGPRVPHSVRARRHRPAAERGIECAVGFPVALCGCLELFQLDANSHAAKLFLEQGSHSDSVHARGRDDKTESEVSSVLCSLSVRTATDPAEGIEHAA